MLYTLKCTYNLSSPFTGMNHPNFVPIFDIHTSVLSLITWFFFYQCKGRHNYLFSTVIFLWTANNKITYFLELKESNNHTSTAIKDIYSLWISFQVVFLPSSVYLDWYYELFGGNRMYLAVKLLSDEISKS